MAATTKIWSNNNAPACEDADLNGFKNENNNLIVGSGQALNIGDNKQTEKAISTYAAGGDFYADSGAADAYVLAPVGLKIAPFAYFTGMKVRFVVGNSNTGGAATINVATLGNINITYQAGGTLLADALRVGKTVILEFDGTNFILVNRKSLRRPVNYAQIRDLNTRINDLVDTEVVYVQQAGQFGAFEYINDVAHGLSDDDGTLIVIHPDWYALRRYETKVNLAWFNPVGDGVADDFTALDNFKTTAEANGDAMLMGVGIYRTATSITFTGQLEMVEGAVLDPDSGDTITINGFLDAGPYQIFTGDGDISFGTKNPFIRAYLPEWFGVLIANIDSVNDVGMARMSDAVPNAATTSWGNGEYTITNFVWPNKRWVWIGTSPPETDEGAPSSTIVGTAGGAAPTVDLPIAGINTSRFSVLRNLRILTSGGGGIAIKVSNLGTDLENVYLGGGGKGAEIDHMTDAKWSNVYALGSSQGMFLSPGAGNGITSCQFNNCTAVCANTTGTALLLNGSVSGSIVGNTFTNQVAQSANRGLAMVGIAAIRNTFIDIWTETIAGTTPKALEDTSTSNSLFLNTQFRDNPATASINYGATSSRFESGQATYALAFIMLAGIEVGANGRSVTSGTGSPEGVVTAPVGSLFMREDGGAATSFYVKESGASSTGWVAK